MYWSMYWTEIQTSHVMIVYDVDFNAKKYFIYVCESQCVLVQNIQDSDMSIFII